MKREKNWRPGPILAILLLLCLLQWPLEISRFYQDQALISLVATQTKHLAQSRCLEISKALESLWQLPTLSSILESKEVPSLSNQDFSTNLEDHFADFNSISIENQPPLLLSLTLFFPEEPSYLRLFSQEDLEDSEIFFQEKGEALPSFLETSSITSGHPLALGSSLFFFSPAPEEGAWLLAQISSKAFGQSLFPDQNMGAFSLISENQEDSSPLIEKFSKKLASFPQLKEDSHSETPRITSGWQNFRFYRCVALPIPATGQEFLWIWPTWPPFFGFFLLPLALLPEIFRKKEEISPHTKKNAPLSPPAPPRELTNSGERPEEESPVSPHSTLQHLLENPSSSPQLPTPMTLILCDFPNFPPFQQFIHEKYPQALLGQKAGDCLALLFCPQPQQVQGICQEVVEEFGCRCYCGQSCSHSESLPLHYAQLLELQALRFWEPERQFFHCSSLATHQDVGSFSEKQGQNLLSALGKNQDVSDLWAEILKNIQKDSLVNQVFAFQRIALLLKNACPQEPDTIPDLSAIGSTLADIQTLSLEFKALFQEVRDQSQVSRRQRLDGLSQEIQEKIHRDFANSSLSSASIASEMELSSAYIGRMFRETTEMSISQYLNQYRIEKACKLLRHSDLSVEIIAGKVGFGNSKYFFVLFKQQIGQTPLQYRKHWENAG